MPNRNNFEIVIALYKNCSGWGVFGCLEILNIAKQSYKYFEPEEHKEINVRLAAFGSNKVKTISGNTITVDVRIEKLKQPDLIIIPGTTGNITEIIDENSDLIKWLKKQAKKGTKIATYCTGTFLLAAAGILKNGKAVTHWYKENEFREMFPDINLQSHKILIDEENLIIGGGASSYHNLMIYLVEKFFGKNPATFTSKLMLIERDRESQTPYSMFIPQKQHGDNSILKSQHFIESNIKDKLSIELLAEKASLSERSFIRRFKNATGNTPLKYIHRVKVEASKKILEQTNKTFDEITHELGYEDIASFRKIFKKYAGIAPIGYKKKYSIENL